MRIKSLKDVKTRMNLKKEHCVARKIVNFVFTEDKKLLSTNVIDGYNQDSEEIFTDLFASTKKLINIKENESVFERNITLTAKDTFTNLNTNGSINIENAKDLALELASEMITDTKFIISFMICELTFNKKQFIVGKTKSEDEDDCEDEEIFYAPMFISISPLSIPKKLLTFNFEDVNNKKLSIMSSITDLKVESPTHMFMYPAFSDGVIYNDKAFFLSKSVKTLNNNLLKPLDIESVIPVSTQKQALNCLINDGTNSKGVTMDKLSEILTTYAKAAFKDDEAEKFSLDEIVKVLKDAKIDISTSVIDNCLALLKISDSSKKAFDLKLLLIKNEVKVKNEEINLTVKGDIRKIKKETIDDKKYLLVEINENESIVVDDFIIR